MGVGARPHLPVPGRKVAWVDLRPASPRLEAAPLRRRARFRCWEETAALPGRRRPPPLAPSPAASGPPTRPSAALSPIARVDRPRVHSRRPARGVAPSKEPALSMLTHVDKDHTVRPARRRSALPAARVPGPSPVPGPPAHALPTPAPPRRRAPPRRPTRPWGRPGPGAGDRLTP